MLEGGSLINGHRCCVVVVLGTFAIGVVDIDKLRGGSVLDTSCAVGHGSVCVKVQERVSVGVDVCAGVGVCRLLALGLQLQIVEEEEEGE